MFPCCSRWSWRNGHQSQIPGCSLEWRLRFASRNNLTIEAPGLLSWNPSFLSGCLCRVWNLARPRQSLSEFSSRHTEVVSSLMVCLDLSCSERSCAPRRAVFCRFIIVQICTAELVRPVLEDFSASLADLTCIIVSAMVRHELLGRSCSLLATTTVPHFPAVARNIANH